MIDQLLKSIEKHRKWCRLLPSQVVVNVAIVWPLGASPKAPGTVGTLGGLVLFLVMNQFLYQTFWPLYFIVLAALIYASFLICGEAEVILGKRDPGEIVLDEVVAVPLCFIGLGNWLQPGWPLLLTIIAGFVLFRVFDIAKPYGIKDLQRFPGGLGVVLDDLAAGLATCAVLNAARLGWALYERFPVT